MNRKKILHHILFSAAILVLLLMGIHFYMGEISAHNFYSCVFFLVAIYTGRWLCARWYLRHKYLPFALNIAACCLSMLAGWWLFIHYFFFPNASWLEVSVNTAPFCLLGIATGVFIKHTRASIQKQVRDAYLSAEQKQSELNLLQSQLSPHFLFNTLNNMYSLSITQQDRLPALLLKLSDLLRYSVYDTKKTFVPLMEDLRYINNYLAFEKMRISDRLVLKEEVANINNPTILIAPMVVIVFIENAFKHAKNTWNEKIYINLSLTLSEDRIVFIIQNSHSAGSNENNLVQENSGLGLVNTIKRLDLLYGNDYRLEQTENNDLYSVKLTLPLK
jgi:hypothetical protein